MWSASSQGALSGMNTSPASIAGDWVDIRVTLSPSGFIGTILKRLPRSYWIRPVPEPTSSISMVVAWWCRAWVATARTRSGKTSLAR